MTISTDEFRYHYRWPDMTRTGSPATRALAATTGIGGSGPGAPLPPHVVAEMEARDIALEDFLRNLAQRPASAAENVVLFSYPGSLGAGTSSSYEPATSKTLVRVVARLNTAGSTATTCTLYIDDVAEETLVIDASDRRHEETYSHAFTADTTFMFWELTEAGTDASGLTLHCYFE